MEGPGSFDKSGGDGGPIGRGLKETHMKGGDESAGRGVPLALATVEHS